MIKFLISSSRLHSIINSSNYKGAILLSLLSCYQLKNIELTANIFLSFLFINLVIFLIIGFSHQTGLYLY